ncbi:hypothetical protein FJZ19_03000 [Candidatus Pacearchaeota archaeon]|nr:hypothetical protein [Candidatus Pacearchaeota archaeon]
MKKRRNKNRELKKGISPIIATVLLIAIVVVIALIIFIWASSFVKEQCEKNKEACEMGCGDVSLDTSLDGEILSLTNTGNVPVVNIEIRKISGGDTEIQRENGLGTGQGNIYGLGGSYDKIEVVPIILGEIKNSKQEFICEKNKIEVS